jgi:hypothetical protein
MPSLFLAPDDPEKSETETASDLPEGVSAPQSFDVGREATTTAPVDDCGDQGDFCR